VRIFLTGAAGFLGSHLAEALLARGDEVVGFDNFDPYYDPAKKEENVRDLSRWPGWFLLRGDIRDRGHVRRVVTADRFDAIVHLAARAGVRPSIEEPELYADVNVVGTAVLLEAAHRAGIRRFVFASSSSVYGSDSVAPFRTDARADRPISPYAATKRAGELLCAAHASLHGTSIASLRYFTIYGPRQRPDMAIMKFIERIDKSRPILVYGDGSARRDFTYVDDAVSGTVKALERIGDGAGHRIYNIGEATTISLSDLIGVVERAMGRKAILEPAVDQPGDVPITHADIDESRREIGYDPRIGIEEGVRRQVDWYNAAARGGGRS
jgi:UDP-glucuronate 4-epimerase